MATKQNQKGAKSMKTSESIKDIAKALASAQLETEELTRAKTASIESSKGHYKYTYADLASVIEAALPALNKHGISVVQSPEDDNGRIKVTTMLVHESGEWIQGELSLPVPVQTPQGYGSAITYARRYGLMAMVGVAPEDDDGKGAGTEPKTKAAREVKENVKPVEGSHRVQTTVLQKLADDAGVDLGKFIQMNIAPDLATRKPRVLTDVETVAAKAALEAQIATANEVIDALKNPGKPDNRAVSPEMRAKAMVYHQELRHTDAQRHALYAELFPGKDSFKDLSFSEVSDLIEYLSRQIDKRDDEEFERLDPLRT